jgi:magnesium chelatase family protein
VRSPHHTSSYTSLVGGGSVPRPGEITLAHRGILFLDEFPEFDRKVIESLRQPLEDRIVSISRARGTVRFPAHFILIAALNPCPCGNKGIDNKICTCAPKNIADYSRKMSGPIVDRIDMWIEVSKVDYEKLLQKSNKTDETVQAKNIVVSTRTLQKKRFERLSQTPVLNSALSTRDIGKICMLSTEAENTLNKAAKIHDLSGRGYHRTLKLARTIADLELSEKIESKHILEALQYRQKYFKMG